MFHRGGPPWRVDVNMQIPLTLCTLTDCFCSIVPPGIIFDIYAPVVTTTTTTYFLNYSCLHLTEIARCRMKFLRDRNLCRAEVSSALYHTMVRLLGVVPNTTRQCGCSLVLPFVWPDPLQAYRSSHSWRFVVWSRTRNVITTPLLFRESKTFRGLSLWRLIATGMVMVRWVPRVSDS